MTPNMETYDQQQKRFWRELEAERDKLRVQVAQLEQKCNGLTSDLNYWWAQNRGANLQVSALKELLFQAGSTIHLMQFNKHSGNSLEECENVACMKIAKAIRSSNEKRSPFSSEPCPKCDYDKGRIIQMCLECQEESR